MSQTPKRPGSRDISELKARLGLKKDAPAASTKATGASGAVVAPPGVALPAPPGVKQSQPAAPAAPRVSEDPFGAMNAMAHAGTVARAPEIVIVNDGKPVESVATHHGIAYFAKFAAVALVPLAIGVVVGQIAKEAKFYNGGIQDAKLIVGDIKAAKKNLVDLQAELDKVAKKGFPLDANLTKLLDTTAPNLGAKAEAVFRTKQNALNAELAGQVLSFYSGLLQLKGMVETHVNAAKADDSVFQNLKKEQADAAAQGPLAGQFPFRYGMVVSSPEGGGAFGANVVELALLCGDGKPSPSGNCSEVSGLAYRTAPGDTWIKGDVAQPGQPVAAKQIVPLLAGDVSRSLVTKSDLAASEILYKQRLDGIKNKVDELINTANAVQTKLNAKANEGERFTFFL